MLDDILFPPDPVANAARVVNSVRSVFPPAVDRHLVGISLKVGVGTPPWLTAEVALVVEFGGGETRRAALMGQLHAAPPRGPSKKILELHVDGAGIWDFERDEFSLDLRFYDSRLTFATLAGDVAIRKRDREEDSYLLISAGGYHPEFPVPATFPDLERLRISLVDTETFRLSLTGYLAFTRNTKQFGAKVELFLGGKNISFEATLSFDALVTEDVGFIVDFDDVGEPCAGEPHARFDEGAGGTPVPLAVRPKGPMSLPPTRPSRCTAWQSRFSTRCERHRRRPLALPIGERRRRSLAAVSRSVAPERPGSSGRPQSSAHPDRAGSSGSRPRGPGAALGIPPHARSSPHTRPRCRLRGC
jgi:hypothetical protein